jgi:hypothetical protein
MVYSEAIELVTPLMTQANAVKYIAEVDKMVWVEDNIMIPAGVNASINSTFGELVCEWIEIKLEDIYNVTN